MNFKSKHCLMFFSIFMILNNVITEEITIKTCASKLELDTCHFESYVIENGVVKNVKYYGECKSGEICSPAGFAYKCVSPKYLLKLNKDCVLNDECQSGLCKEGKCSESSVGEPCTSNRQCGGKGFYCKDEDDYSKVCAKYAYDGETCGDGIECIPYLACGKDKCIKKYSLENGEETHDHYACKSGVAENLGSGYICTDITVTNKCSTENTCLMEYKYGDKKKEIYCDCEYTSDGKYECDYQDGSLEMQEYMKLYKEKFEELKEEDLEEIENYYTLDSEDLMEAYVKYQESPKLKAAEQCVIDYYVSEKSLEFQSFQRTISLKKTLLIGLIALLI